MPLPSLWVTATVSPIDMIGPVIGAIVLTFLPELLRGFGELRLMIYGAALTLVVLFMPGGIVQAWMSLRHKARR